MAVHRSDGRYIVTVTRIRRRDRGERYEVEGYWRGHRRTTRARTSSGSRAVAVAAADALWAEYTLGHLEAPDAPPLTVGDLVDRYVARETGRGRVALSPATSRANRSHLSALLRVTGRDMPLAHLSARHVEAAVMSPPRPRSRLTYLRAIRGCVRWAVAAGWLAVDVTAGIEVDGGRAAIRPRLTRAQVEAMLAACEPATALRASWAVETGMRADELCAARWSWLSDVGIPSVMVPEIDPDTGWRCKGRQARGIPLTDEALRVLAVAGQRWGRTGYILHGEASAIRGNTVARKVAEACRRARVPVVRLQALRRTAGSLWLAAGLRMEEVRQLLGHESITTTERWYADLPAAHLAARFRSAMSARATPMRGRTRSAAIPGHYPPGTAAAAGSDGDDLQ